MSRIFVSYRRKDSAGHAGRVFDHLRTHFGADRVFRDVDRLKPGDDFVEALARAVDSCEVFILVIGRDWIDARNDRGERRLDDPADFIRLELETALRRKILVVPVLVEGAAMARAEDLPEPLRPLARRQAIELSEHRWDFDIQELLRRIEETIGRRRPAWKSAPFRVAAGVIVLAPAIWSGRSWWPEVSFTTSAVTEAPAAQPAANTTEPSPATHAGGSSPSVAARDLPIRGDDPPADSVRPTSASGPANRARPTPPADVPTKPGDARPSETPAVRVPETVSVRLRDTRSTAGRAPTAPVRLPTFVGQPFRDVMGTIRGLGLRLKTEAIAGGRYEPDTVFRQSPAAGSVVAPGDLVHLFIEMKLEPHEHAAGRRYLSPAEMIHLDRGEGPGGWDVAFGGSPDQHFYLEFGKGALGALLLDPTNSRNTLNATACLAAKLSGSRVAISTRVAGQLVCVKTTRGRTAVIQLRGLTLNPPELYVRYSTAAP